MEYLAELSRLGWTLVISGLVILFLTWIFHRMEKDGSSDEIPGMMIGVFICFVIGSFIYYGVRHENATKEYAKIQQHERLVETVERREMEENSEIYIEIDGKKVKAILIYDEEE